MATQTNKFLFNAHFLIKKRNVHLEVIHFKIICYLCLLNYFLCNLKHINTC